MKKLGSSLAALALSALLASQASAAHSPTEKVSGGGKASAQDGRVSIGLSAKDKEGDEALGRGNVSIRMRDADGKTVERFHGRVSCLDVEGSAAVLTGAVKKGVDAAGESLAGRAFRVLVTDGKEAGVADTFSYEVGAAGEQFEACAIPVADPDATPEAPHTLEHGNIKVVSR